MKRITIVLLLLVVICIYTADCYSEGGVKLFFDGNTYTLNSQVLFYDNEYFFDAFEFSSILGMACQIDGSEKVLKIAYKGTQSAYPLRTFDYPKSIPENHRHDTPELINDRIYFPFSFIKDKYKLVIKYNKSSGVAYILPKTKLGRPIAASFTNLSFDYSISIPEGIEIDIGNSDNNFQDSTLSILDKDNIVSGTITCDRLGESSLNIMRQYLNDYISADEEIFRQLAGYKNSYFRAMQDYYKRDFLYGSDDERSDESNIKILNEYNEKLYGQDAYIVLYNTIKSDRLSSMEETHIDISIPVYENKTIYSLNFSVKKSYVNETTLKKICTLINSVKILDLTAQADSLSVFSDKESIDKANLGIYPDLRRINITYTDFINSESGYRLTYPSVFIPYRQNNIIDAYDYQSFKINYNQFFSVSSEPAYSNTAALEKIKLIKELSKGSINVIEEGTAQFRENSFRYIKYEITDSKGQTYLEDYFTVTNSRLYDVQLSSRFIRPYQKVKSEFSNILDSLQFMPPSPPAYSVNLPFTGFINKEEGYSFSYPASWHITENSSTDVGYDIFKAVSPDFSGPLDISVCEGELASDLPPVDILKYAAAPNQPGFKEHFKKYSAPYKDRVSTPLTSNYLVKNGVTYIFKTVNYLDASNRSKLCYSMDIIRGRKIVSLFISVSDYATLDGKVSNKSLRAIVNLIKNSFSAENTKELEERLQKGETRNRKIVFIESYFKQVLGAAATVSSATYLTPAGYVMATVDGISDSGFYKIRMDFDKKEIAITDRVFKRDILSAAAEELKKRYKERTIRNVTLHESDMTIDIEYSDSSESSSLVRRIYTVDTDLAGSTPNWKLTRKDHAAALMNDCKSFFENYYLTNIDLYFYAADNFANIDDYQEKGRKYTTAVYADFAQAPGYFILQINPLNDSLTLLSYTSLETIYGSIRNLYSSPGNDYSVVSCSLSDVDKFEVKVLLLSKANNTHRVDKIKLNFNPETHSFDLVNVTQQP